METPTFDELNLKNVCMVDDHVFDHKFITYVFKNIQNYNVKLHHFYNGQEFLNNYEKFNNIDLIILDQCMPELNGLQVLQKLMEEQFNIPPIILYTANSFIDPEIKNNYGFIKDVILKPASYEKILKCINSNLNNVSTRTG